MLLDIGAQIAAGAIVGLSLVTAAAVVLGLIPRRRAAEQAPPDLITSPVVVTVAAPVDGRRENARPDADRGRDGIGPDDVPPGTRMTPLSGWDLLGIGLILLMALATPPATAVLAPVVVVAALVDTMSGGRTPTAQADGTGGR
jgi:hypothetical protein